MTQRVCETCEFFAPARTCFEKPTWGHCQRLVQAKQEPNVPALRPFFTWADNHCDDFQVRPSSAVSR